VTVEGRLRRRQALGFIRELRAVAHLVDMHQLTKDPDRLLWPVSATESSPVRTLTHVELVRYLDYCSELLSLTSKIAALYAERLIDAVVLQAVDEVETLTNGLSIKIWQKLIVLGAGLVDRQSSGSSETARRMRSPNAGARRLADQDDGASGRTSQEDSAAARRWEDDGGAPAAIGGSPMVCVAASPSS
jgi:hypothetical protein